jgi:ubiquinone/menaquinone biosynthesis C-methylase UbiE
MKNIHELNKISYDQSQSINFFHRQKELMPIEKVIIEKYFGGKILDLGCGTGRTTKNLADMGFNVIGVDNNKAMIDAAKKDFPDIQFKAGDACALEFNDASFDIVFFSYNGIDYIHPEGRRLVALSEMARVLKPGGLLIYSSHNPWAILPRGRFMFILRNILKGRLFSRYKYEKEGFGIGLYCYYAGLGRQKWLARKAGFKLIAKESPYRYPTLSDLWPSYIFKKK